MEGKHGELRKQAELVAAAEETAMPVRKGAEREAQPASAHPSADDMYEQGMAAAKRMRVANSERPAPKAGAVSRTAHPFANACIQDITMNDDRRPWVRPQGCQQRPACHETTDMKLRILVLCLCIKPGRPTWHHLVDRYRLCPVASVFVLPYLRGRQHVILVVVCFSAVSR